MTDALRLWLRTASVATIAMAAWLLWVIVGVLPAHDPGGIWLWSAVAAGSLGLAGLSLAETRRQVAPVPPLRLALAALGVVATAFGALVLVTELGRSAGHSEGYLVVIGLILVVHGTAVLAWLAATARRPAR
jgi:hypothetical protein